jgi:chorismate mutase
MSAQPAHSPDADATAIPAPVDTGPIDAGPIGAGPIDASRRDQSAGARHRLRVRALRGATTVDEDSSAQVTDRTQELLKAMLARNGVEHTDIISVLFTATDDVHSMFPATAARAIGFGDVPLLCARELDIKGAQPRCIRVMMHVETTREELHHIYLEGARGLRDDLPE